MFFNLILGLILFVFGWIAMVIPIQAISQMVYPILWWGFILAVDAISFRRWRESPLISHPRHFFGIIAPLSALYWLYFELVNIYYPQWSYTGITAGIFTNTLLSFISFATVIPAVLEIFWFFHGPVGRQSKTNAVNGKLIFSAVGLALAIIPFFSNNFVINQLVWVAPFLIFLPLIRNIDLGARFAIFAISAGILSGFFWELFNFWAGGKWEYLILQTMPHLFEMPILGYVGFIPFAFSTIAIYVFAKERITANKFLIGVLYLSALLASYLFTLSI